MLKFKLFVDDQEVYVTTSPVQAWAYDVAVTYGNRSHEEAVECANLAEYIYLKDENTIPTGYLVDVVAMNLEKLRTIKNKWDLINYVSNCERDYEEEL